MCTENIMMEAVKRGADRQEMHEAIRRNSMEAAANVKMNGERNDLLDRIAADPAFGLDLASLNGLLDSSLYIGRAPAQVEEFLNDDVYPILKKYKKEIESLNPELRV